MRARRPLAIAVAVVCYGAAAHADDTQVWSEVGVRHSFSKKVSVGYDQHLRFDDSASRVSAFMPEIGARYRPATWLRVGAGYRYAYKRDDAGDFAKRHRLHADVSPRLRIDDLTLKARIRYQERVSSGDPNLHTMRGLAGVDWKVKRRTGLFVAGELFVRLGDNDTIHRRKTRLTFGIEQSYRRHDFGVFYRREWVHDDPDDPDRNILGLGYRVTL